MKKLKMKIDLSETNFEREFDLELILENDYSELGDVMYEAYEGTIDYNNESREEAAIEVKETLGGKYGQVINEVCLKVVSSGEIASAIVYNIFSSENLPMMTFAMTRRKFKGQGYSQRLIKESLRRLKTLGHKECLLFVTEGNEPAFSIYKKFGFQEV